MNDPRAAGIGRNLDRKISCPRWARRDGKTSARHAGTGAPFTSHGARIVRNKGRLTPSLSEVLRFLGPVLLAPALTAQVALAQVPPSGPITGGILVGDLTLDQILLTRDLDGNGEADGPDEAPVFFDDTNLSGLPSPTGGVFTLHQAASGYLFIGDGNTDAVYRLDDANHDGDANDEDEATVWFSEADNAAAFTLPTPNGIFEAPDGAVYIVNAGVRSRPTDAVYRTEDLNGDGDANDAGEATLWLDLGVLASELLGVEPNRSSAFDITFIGRTAYIADTMGGEPDTIFSARDRNRNGVIDSGELAIFIDDTNPFGVPVSTGLTSSGKDLYVSESSRSAEQSVVRLTDSNENGQIDDASEVVEVWNESQVPADVELGSSFGLAISFDGQVYLTSAGGDPQDNLFRLVDLDGDGRFLSPGETIVWRSGNGTGVPVDFPRSLASLHDFLAAQGYFAVSNVNDHNDLPKDVGEIADLLSVTESGDVPDYDAIRKLYSKGKNSVKPNGDVRTIAGFADGVDFGDPRKDFEVIFPDAVAYFGRADFLDAFLSSAIDGTGRFAYASDAQRAAAISQGLRSLLSYWVRFELRFSASKAADGNFACPKGAPHNWDEGFAFYYGPKGKDSLFAFARELSSDFDLRQPVNRVVTRAFRRGLERLVPDRPAPGQIECNPTTKPAQFPKRKQARIEEQLFRTFLLGILRSAETMASSRQLSERLIARSEAQALYLAVAPEVREASRYADKILTKLLKQKPRRSTGRQIQRVVASRFDGELGLKNDDLDLDDDDDDDDFDDEGDEQDDDDS